MIIFKQKEFGSPINNIEDFLKGGSKGREFITQGPLNVMKSIEMWSLLDEDGRSYVSHWIGDMVNKELLNKFVKKRISPQLMFCFFEENPDVISNAIGSNNFDTYVIKKGFGYGKNFVKNVKTRLLTEIKRGVDPSEGAKYESWFKDNPIITSDKDYAIRFKYIALCLSGQMDPNQDDISDSNCYRRILTTDVDYDTSLPKSKLSHKFLTETIVKCIENINMWLPEEVTEGLKKYNYEII